MTAPRVRCYGVYRIHAKWGAQLFADFPTQEEAVAFATEKAKTSQCDFEVAEIKVVFASSNV